MDIMYRTHVFSLWILSISFGGVAVAKPSHVTPQHVQPFGILMCLQRCQRVSWCHSITYNTCDTSCNIGNMQDDKENDGQCIFILNVTKVDVTWTGRRSKRCPMKHILLMSRTKKLQCTAYGRRKQDFLKSRKAVRAYFNISTATYVLCQRLHDLCERGNTKEALSCLAKLSQKTEDGSDTPCWTFSSFANAHRCNLSCLDMNKYTILHIAVHSANVDVVKCILFKQCVNFDHAARRQNTAIILAARRGYTTIFNLLMKAGCSLSIVNDAGETVLHKACEGGSLAIVKDIVRKRSVDIDGTTHKGRTPLMTALAYGKKDIVHHLILSGSNVTRVDNDGMNLLHIASVHGHTHFINYIITNNIVDIDSTDARGRTPIMYAALNSHRGAFFCLLKNHCNLSIVDKLGNNVIHMAVKGPHPPYIIIKTLYNRMGRAALNHHNYDGKTPINTVDRFRKLTLYSVLARLAKTDSYVHSVESWHRHIFMLYVYVIKTTRYF